MTAASTASTSTTFALPPLAEIGLGLGSSKPRSNRAARGASREESEGLAAVAPQGQGLRAVRQAVQRSAELGAHNVAAERPVLRSAASERPAVRGLVQVGVGRQCRRHDGPALRVLDVRGERPLLELVGRSVSVHSWRPGQPATAARQHGRTADGGRYEGRRHRATIKFDAVASCTSSCRRQPRPAL